MLFVLKNWTQIAIHPHFKFPDFSLISPDEIKKSLKLKQN